MLPFILGVLGGYLIGDSIKDDAIEQSDAKLAVGGGVNINYQIIVISQKWDKSWGNLDTYRFFVNAESEQQAKRLAKKMWEKENTESDTLRIVEILNNKDYINKYPNSPNPVKYRYSKEDVLPPEGYAEGGEIDDDAIAYAKSKAMDNIDWDELLREYASNHYYELTQREKGEIISEMQKDFYRSYQFAEGGEVSKSWGVMLFKESKNRNGERIESAFNNLIMKGTLKQVIEDVKDELMGNIIYGTIKDRAGDVLVAKVKQDGTINIYREGYGIDKMAKGGKVKFRKGSSYYYKNQFQFRAEKVIFVDYELGSFIFKDSDEKEFKLLQYQVDEYITKDAPIVNIGIEFAEYLRSFIVSITDESPRQLSLSLSDNINAGKKNGEFVITFVEEIKDGRDSRFEKDDILKLNGKSFSYEGIDLTFSSIKFTGEEEQETDSTYSVYVYYYYDVKYSIN